MSRIFLQFFSALLGNLLYPNDFILAVALQLLAVFGGGSLVHDFFVGVLEFDVCEFFACDSVRLALALLWCVEPVNEREQRSEEHGR